MQYGQSLMQIGIIPQARRLWDGGIINAENLDDAIKEIKLLLNAGVLSL
jgi:hypothetical protein